MCASFVRGPSTPQASRVASGSVSAVLREGCEAKCIMPQPVPWRAESACAPRMRASDPVPKPISSGQALTRPLPCPFTRAIASSVSRNASAVDWASRPGPRARSQLQRPSTARRPTSSTARATAGTSKSVPASQKVVVPLRSISRQASWAAAASSSGVMAA
jgi:hypothetical protein